GSVRRRTPSAVVEQLHAVPDDQRRHCRGDPDPDGALPHLDQRHFGGRPGAASSCTADQPTISISLKKKRISFLAFSSESEPWVEFASTDSPKSFRIVPSAAFAGLVAPMRSRLCWTAFSPSSTCTTTGPEVMNVHRSLKNGRSRWTS